NAFAARLAAGHHTLGRGQYGDAKAALHALDVVAAHVNAATGTRNARQITDGSFRAAVLEVHAQHQPAILVLRFIVRDVALLLEDAGDLGLELRCRNIELLMTRPDGIPDARQKIRYRVTQTHSFSFIPRSSAAAETCGNGLRLTNCRQLPAVSHPVPNSIGGNKKAKS